jgi:hypothetical protein
LWPWHYLVVVLLAVNLAAAGGDGVGYDVHISRRDHWSDEDGPAITLDEWQRVIADDPELSPDPDDSNGSTALWRGASEHAEPWLAWDEGNVKTKNPDEALLRKALELAARLEARVQGDDGELYRVERGVVRSDAEDGAGGAQAKQRPSELVLLWWWLGLLVVVTGLTVVFSITCS